ncbi:MAG: VOC family protein [Cyanobacteria bacterium J06632_22]
MAITQGAHHLGLTVPDINATRDFFVDVLEFKQVGAKPDYPAYFVSDGTLMLTLWQATDAERVTPFDRKNNIGLHHFALRVDGGAALNALYQTLADTAGVTIEFPPEPLGKGPAQHMMFSIPGGIRMELITLSS